MTSRRTGRGRIAPRFLSLDTTYTRKLINHVGQLTKCCTYVKHCFRK